MYLSLHTSSPGETDGNEISGNGYSRQAIAFDAAHATNGTAANSDVESFTASGGSFGTITHFGIHDASTDGNLLYYGAVSPNKTIADGDTLQFAAGSIVITEA